MMDTLVQAFVTHLDADTHVPASTAAAYGTDVRQFVAFIRERQQDPHHTTPPITTADMEAFCTWLQSEGYAVATVARRVTSLRVFGAFLVAQGWAATNPGDGLQPPKRVKLTHTPLTAEQLQSLCARPLTAQTPESWRDCALLHTLTTTGLRASDLVSIDVTHLDLEHGLVRLPNGRSQTLAAPVVMALATYLTLGRPRLLHGRAGEWALFLNCRGQRLTRQGCWVIVKQHARALDLPDVSLERLRLSPQHAG